MISMEEGLPLQLPALPRKLGTGKGDRYRAEVSPNSPGSPERFKTREDTFGGDKMIKCDSRSRLEIVGREVMGM